MDSNVIVARPRGGGGYLVAQLSRMSMRICRAPFLDQAAAVRREWERAEYSIAPGEMRPLMCLPHPHPPLVAYAGPEHLQPASCRG